MIEKLGAYAPIKAVDAEAVFEMVVDPQCVALVESTTWHEDRQ